MAHEDTRLPATFSDPEHGCSPPPSERESFGSDIHAGALGYRRFSSNGRFLPVTALISLSVHEDHQTSDDRILRIFVEPMSICSPCGPRYVILDVTDRDKVVKVDEHLAFPNESEDQLLEQARAVVKAHGASPVAPKS